MLLPTKKIKARSKGTHWKEWDSSILRVSVGYHRFEGPEFDALLGWLTKPGRFQRVILLLSDRLAIHNIKSIYSKTTKEATEIALKQGYEWSAQNKSKIDAAKKKFDGELFTINWRDAKHSAEQAAIEGVVQRSYATLSERLSNAYDADESFRHFVHADIDRFVTSRRRLIDSDTIFELKQTSVDYIMEELAVHSLLRERYDDACHVYPGSQLKSEKYLIDHHHKYPWCALDSEFYVELRLE